MRLPRSLSFLRPCAALVVCVGALTQVQAEDNLGVIRNYPVLKAGKSLPDIDFDVNSGKAVIDFANLVEYPSASGDYARIQTDFGDIYLEFLTGDAPLTVANFKSYLATNATPTADLVKTYDGTFIHRSVPGFVIQGGGFLATTDLLEIISKAPVMNEFKVANTRGTVAMAKVGPEPGSPPTPTTINSATNQWFFNLGDNRQNLDNANGGFTAFARVLGDGMGLVDDIASLPRHDLYADVEDAFDAIPYHNVHAGQTELEVRNLIVLNKIRAVPASEVPAAFRTPALTLSLVSAGFPALAQVTFAKNVLTIVPGKKTEIGGRLPVTVRASIGNGFSTDFTFYVSRSRLPAILTPLPGKISKPFGAVATLSASITGWPAGTIQWERLVPGGFWTAITVADPLFTGETSADLNIALNSTTAPASVLAALQNNQFRFVATNSLGSVRSTPTTLTVTTLPVGFATQPPKLVVGTLGASAAISTAALPAAGNTPHVYRWERKPAGSSASAAWVVVVNSAPAAPTRYSGATTATLTISLLGADEAARQAALALNDDQYRCVVSTAFGTATSTPAALRVLTARATLVTNESILLPGLEGREGRTFSAAGLPKGLVFETSSGSGVVRGISTDKPGVYKVTVTIRDSGAVTGTRIYYLEVAALSGNNAGGFEALLSASGQPPVAKLAFLVNGTGGFTGTLTTAVEPAPLSFSGAVVRSTTGVLTASDLVIPLPGAPAGRAYVVTGLTIAADSKLSAKLKTRTTAGALPVEIASTATGTHLAAFSKTAAAPWALVSNGAFINYHFAFTAPTPLALPPAGTPAASVPVGSGYARAPITVEGRLNLAGKLPDGAPLTASLSTGTDASYRLFARPYSAFNGAYVSSDFRLTANVVSNGTGGVFSRYALAANGGEDTFWQRPPGIGKPAAYAAGFAPLGLKLQVQPWLFFGGNDIGLDFLSDGKRAAIGIALSGPTLANAAPNPRTLPTDLFVDRQTLKFTSANPPDASALTLTLSNKTGIFSGTLKLRDGAVSRTVAVEGLFLVPTNLSNGILPNGTVTAEGFATIPGLNGAAPTTERVRLYKQGAVPAP